MRRPESSPAIVAAGDVVPESPVHLGTRRRRQLTHLFTGDQGCVVVQAEFGSAVVRTHVRFDNAFMRRKLRLQPRDIGIPCVGQGRQQQ